MEPLRGGNLVSLQDETVEGLKRKHNLVGVSNARIAFNFVYDQPEVLLALSGMNAMSQVSENIQIASEATANSQGENEKAFLADLKAYLATKETIPCTSCRYCIAECPQNIEIPRAFDAYNNAIIFENIPFAKATVERWVSNIGDCVECEQCMKVCPQHIEIPKQLKTVRQHLGSD